MSALDGLRRAGRPLDEAGGALVLLHGRGATAQSILPLAGALDPDGRLAHLAPQAPGNRWYPYSFLEPRSRNQPDLDAALATVTAILDALEARGVGPERVVLAGFSQGACLAGEAAARRQRRYGALLLFSGGLIGEDEDVDAHRRAPGGGLAGTPALLGCSDVDPHIPLARVEASAAALERLGAAVDARVYPGMGHTVNDDELERARALVARLGAGAGAGA